MYLLATLVLACTLAPISATSAASRPGDDVLSFRLADLAKPAVRSMSPARQAKELSLPTAGPGSLLREGSRVLAEVRFDHGAAAGVDDLRATGAKVLDVSPRYQTVTVAAKPAGLHTLSDVPRVAAATEVLAPIAAASTCPSGMAISEGDDQLRADEARLAPFEVDGSGVTVGILSDSFDQATEAADGSGPVETHEAEDAESGDLPGASNTCTGQSTPVDVLEDYVPEPEEPEPGDEGRAMAQIVHDLAPGANLSFATAFTGLTAFAGNVEALAAAGAKVMVDDVSYPQEPFFQEGPVGVAVSDVSDGGVSYFSSAANNNLINGGKDIASWEAQQYRDSGACPSAVVALSEALEEEGSGLNPTHCMDFNPGSKVDRTFRITVAKGATLIIDIQWAEPWNGVKTDMDTILLGPEGLPVAGGIEDNVFGTQQPFEFVGWENKTGAVANVQLVINRYNGGNPRLKFALLQNGGGVTSTEYESSVGGDVIGPTIFGHNGAEDAISVGAIRYDATESPEKYSSRGPVTHYFGPVSGTTPAPSQAQTVLSKPDLTATDCGATTFFAAFAIGEGVWRFCGTSAAAPHAAAVAALMRQKVPAAIPEEIRTALVDGATAIGTAGPCAVGAGLIDAVGALEQLLVPSPVSRPACTPPISFPVIDEGGNEPPATPVAPVAETPPPSPEAPQADRSPPRTFLIARPSKSIRIPGRRVTVAFRFGSNEPGVTFLCKFDRSPFGACRSRTVRRLGLGLHVLQVKARDAAGNTDRTPAVYRFRVLHAD